MTKDMRELTNGPQLQQALTALAATMSEAQSALKMVDWDMGPVISQLPGIANTLQSTLKQTDQLMRSVGRGYGDDTQFHRDCLSSLAAIRAHARVWQ